MLRPKIFSKIFPPPPERHIGNAFKRQRDAAGTGTFAFACCRANGGNRPPQPAGRNRSPDGHRQSPRASDVACRLGGDEFAIILPGADLHAAGHVAQRIFDHAVPLVQARFGQQAGQLSIGIAEATAALTIAQILEIADRRMYCAKRQRGNRFVADDEL